MYLPIGAAGGWNVLMMVVTDLFAAMQESVFERGGVRYLIIFVLTVTAARFLWKIIKGVL